MKAQDFLDWMEATDTRFAADIVDKLGLGRNPAQKLLASVKAGQDVEIKRSVALAMAAVAAGLPPWKGEDDDK